MLLRKLRHADLYYRALRYRWKVEPGEIQFLRQHLQPGSCAVDIGAHKGAYTFWMQRCVGRRGHVFSFEPQPVLARRLRAAVTDLSLAHVTVEEMGLSSREGSLSLFVPGGEAPSPGATLERPHCEGGASFDVPVTTLDAYFGPRGRVHLVKCDVEGHELDVFRGGEQLLRRHRPALLFECEEQHQRQHRIEDVFRFLEGLGYRGRFFWGTRLLALSEFSAGEHQRRGRRPYANNFVFLAR